MKPIAAVTPGHSPYHANYNNPVMFTDPLGLCPECPRDKRYYDARDNFLDYEPTSYVSPNLNGNSWVHSIGRNSRVYERYQMWSDARTLGLDEYAQKYGEAYTNMNAYWRYYQEEQMVNGVQVKRPQLIISGKVNSGYKQKPNGGTNWLQLGKNVALYGGIQSGFVLDQSVDIALKESRGRYEGPKEFLRKQTNLKSISKVTKGVSGAFTTLSVITSFAEFAASDQSGADYARLVGAGVIIGTNFIPYAGPLISASLAISDATGQFDSFYDGFDNATYRSMFFNSLLSGGRTTVGPFKP